MKTAIAFVISLGFLSLSPAFADSQIQRHACEASMCGGGLGGCFAPCICNAIGDGSGQCSAPKPLNPNGEVKIVKKLFAPSIASASKPSCGGLFCGEGYGGCVAPCNCNYNGAAGPGTGNCE